MTTPAKTLFVSTSSLAAAFGIRTEVVWRWVKAGKLKAVCIQGAKSDQASTEPYKTTRGRLYIPMDEVERLLHGAYSGDPEYRRLLRSITKRARELPMPSSGQVGEEGERSTDSRPISIPGKPLGEL